VLFAGAFRRSPTIEKRTVVSSLMRDVDGAPDAYANFYAAPRFDFNQKTTQPK